MDDQLEGLWMINWKDYWMFIRIKKVSLYMVI